MNVVAVIQARMGSARLPGKVLMPILGQPLLALLIDRVRRARRLDQILVATSEEKRDDRIAEFITKLPDVTLFRGSEQDVLSRFAGAARAAGADLVMRITADNPFFDWELADLAIERCIGGGFDYLSTPGTPLGVGLEVFSAQALYKAAREAVDSYDREHVTAYFYRNPELFELGELPSSADLSHVRLTVDTPADLELARSHFERFGTSVTYREIVDGQG